MPGHLKVFAAVSKPKLMGTYSFFRSPSIVLGQPFTCAAIREERARVPKIKKRNENQSLQQQYNTIAP